MIPLLPPKGLAEIKRVFGDPSPYFREDGRIGPQWEAAILGVLHLPSPLTLGWDLSKTVSRIRVHQAILQPTHRALKAIHEAGLWDELRTFDGAYNFRSKRTSRRLSLHCWGVALDFNASEDPQGDEQIDMAEGVVRAFEHEGFEWGGRWATPDPMHYQYARGY